MDQYTDRKNRAFTIFLEYIHCYSQIFCLITFKFGKNWLVSYPLWLVIYKSIVDKLTKFFYIIYLCYIVIKQIYFFNNVLIRLSELSDFIMFRTVRLKKFL